MRKYLVAIGILIGISCSDDLAFSDFHATDNGSWSRDQAMVFEVSDPDTTTAHNLYFYLRNDNTYPYSNLFLIAELTYPDGQSERDTLEYRMADANGKWLGSGLGDVKENKLGFKKDVVFPTSGVYTITVSHAMRKNGSVRGIDSLPGVLDVGFQIESNQ